MPARFSVITVTFNDKEGLEATLNSVAAQRPKGELEQIVVDGGSSYDVASVVLHGNSNALLVSEADDGIYDGMNKGIALSSGEFIIFMNSGDVFADDRVLERIEAVAVSTDPDFIFGDANEQLTNGKIISKTARDIKRAPFGMITHHQAMLFRKTTVVHNAIGYDLNYPLAGDYDFFLRFLRVSKGNVQLDFPLCIFGQGGTSYQNWHKARNEQFDVRRSVYGSFIFAAAVYCLQLVQGYARRWFPGLHSFFRGK